MKVCRGGITPIGSYYHGGFTLLDLLVSLLIISVVLSSAVAAFSNLSRLSLDNKAKVTAQLEAQAALEMMASDFRLIGNGVPFHQANFLIGQANLSDNTKTQPILVTGTTSTQIKFRLNQTGEVYILTADFNPTTSSTISLTSVSKIAVNDEIYMTNSTVAQDDGLWGKVTAIDSGANTVTIASSGANTKVYTPSAIFQTGSLLEVVPTVTYTSTANYGGITRDDGSGVQALVSTGQFTLSYLNSAGSAVTLPLVADPDEPFSPSAIQNVHSISISIDVQTPSNLTTGSKYVGSVSQTIGIRNLNYTY